jgi:hypothetical protein
LTNISQNKSPNFSFLSNEVPHLYRIIVCVERYFFDDPNTYMMKVRQFAEGLTKRIAAKIGFYYHHDEKQNFHYFLNILLLSFDIATIANGLTSNKIM